MPLSLPRITPRVSNRGGIRLPQPRDVVLRDLPNILEFIKHGLKLPTQQGNGDHELLTRDWLCLYDSVDEYGITPHITNSPHIG